MRCDEKFFRMSATRGKQMDRFEDHHITGVHCWPGKQMHSHSYRVPDPFRGQVVMVIGYQPSGMDISRDIAGVAKEVHVAMRSEPPYQMHTTTATGHANLWLHSCTIERAEEDGSLVFQDGSKIKADVVLHCTGYKYNFPFLGDSDDELAGAISVDDNRVGPLYKHVFPPMLAPPLNKHVSPPMLAPHVSFIGLPFRTIPFLVFQLQSKWVAGVLSGRLELPSQEAMMRDVDAFYSDMEARGCAKRRTHDLGQGNPFEYEDWVAEQCGLGRMEGWRKGMFVATCKNLADRPDSYRDE
uniref:Flavin-containing monooxygenase n=1 Tax=Aegilops tauschii TaxID=37682 RepID=M8AXH9_AEGTA